MERSCKVLLAFVLAAMVNGRPLTQTILEDSPLKLIDEAVDFYNGESHSDVVFMFYKDEYDYRVGPKGQKQVNFTIKETACLKSENHTEGDCEFLPDGLEKRCTASRNDQERRFSVVCTDISVKTKKDPESGYVEKSGSLEDDYTDQPEDGASYEDHIITMDDDYPIFLEEDREEKRLIDEFLASRTKNVQGNHLTSKTSERKLQPGQFLGRFLCIECFFDVLPR